MSFVADPKGQPAPELITVERRSGAARGQHQRGARPSCRQRAASLLAPSTASFRPQLELQRAQSRAAPIGKISRAPIDSIEARIAPALTCPAAQAPRHVPPSTHRDPAPSPTPAPHHPPISTRPPRASDPLPSSLLSLHPAPQQWLPKAPGAS